MGEFKDLTGAQSNIFTVIRQGSERIGKCITWVCKCNKCGKERLATTQVVRAGRLQCTCTPNLHTKNDIAGQKFGKLIAEKYIGRSRWDCKCDCGNTTKASYNDLIIGRRKSCGKCTTQIKDITGQKFGKLVVMGLAYVKDGRAYWKCECSCKNHKITVHNGKDLRMGKIKSCGCGHHDVAPNHDLTGMTFGRLTVIARAGRNEDGRAMWNCRCDCGKYKVVAGHNLLSGNNTTCGNHIAEQRATRNREHAFSHRPDYPQWFIDELYYEEDKGRAKNKTLTTSEKVWFNCPIHGKYAQWVSDHIKLSTLEKQHGCPDCSNHVAHMGSNEENEIKNYLCSITGAYIAKARILDIHDGNRLKEIDMYIEELNLGIEYNGSPFHATKNGAYSNNKPKLYHQKKFLAAKEQGIHLISIFDVDWNTNKDKIKMYLKSLVVQNKKVFARKCEIKLVNKKEANIFTDKYHLQGHARLSSINYGLYCNNELLSVMSFGKLRLKKSEEGQYELHRYCVKDGYTVVGGANRLLKAFEREYSPKFLLSFSDNDYFMGGIYEKLNFANKGQSTPRYYWFLNGAEIKREKCQLKYLKRDFPELLQEAYDTEASNKEDYVMEKLGACKVYRSGNTRWVKDYTS